jgi:inward rectifier potassium channel
LANVIVTIEVIVGLIVMSLFTGLMFAKFSRPQSKVIFSKYALIRSRNSVPFLIFRLANERENTISHANVRVSLLKFESTEEGDKIRKFYDLKLERSSTPLFSLSWTVMHAIDEHSPLYEMTQDEMERTNIWIAVSFTGHDEILSQSIHRHHVYKASDILFDHVFVDTLKEDSKGQLYVDYALFHKVNELKDD